MITMQITKRYHRVIDYDKLLSSYIGQIPCNSSPPFCPLSPRTQIFYSSSYVPIILPHLQFVKKRLFYKTAFWLELYHSVTSVKSRTSAYESTASRSHIKAYQRCNDLKMSPWVVLSSLFIKKFERMARETNGHMFASGKWKQQSRFDSYGVRKCIAHIPYYLSELSRADFFPTTFLEIAVYQLGSKIKRAS